ncbi:hypothetical protein BB561_006077 [Smittium simulii]|uniref:Uncharacterized protein n=1 Tax=Smittium simulii TaxID=133385 RepID=A0A2T9Y6S5_9FUNG|nr:hypothetical protein BB561_006077 [Smittium simulii]
MKTSQLLQLISCVGIFSSDVISAPIQCTNHLCTTPSNGWGGKVLNYLMMIPLLIPSAPRSPISGGSNASYAKNSGSNPSVNSAYYSAKTVSSTGPTGSLTSLSSVKTGPHSSLASGATLKNTFTPVNSDKILSGSSNLGLKSAANTDLSSSLSSIDSRIAGPSGFKPAQSSSPNNINMRTGSPKFSQESSSSSSVINDGAGPSGFECGFRPDSISSDENMFINQNFRYPPENPHNSPVSYNSENDNISDTDSGTFDDSSVTSTNNNSNNNSDSGATSSVRNNDLLLSNN